MNAAIAAYYATLSADFRRCGSLASADFYAEVAARYSALAEAE